MTETAARHPLRRFWRIATPYWREGERARAWGLLVLLVLLLIGQTRFAVLFNEQTGEFTSALAARDGERFWAALRYSLGLLLFAVPVYAFYYYVRDRLGLLWRLWLTGRFLEQYFARGHYYALNARALIDNPDQRIAEDINTFTQRTLYFLLILIGALLQLAAFSAVLWSISHTLVWFLVFYAACGTFVTLAVFGRPLVGLNFHQLRREADFRFGLVRVRENAEAIAFYRGEGQEAEQLRRRFAAVFDNYSRLIRSQLFLNLFQYAYGLLTIVLPSALIAGDVLAGDLEVGVAVQAAGAFAAVLSALSVIVENFEGLSRFAAGLERLDTFARVLTSEPDCPADTPARITSVQGDVLALERLTLLTPDGTRTLVKDLTLGIAPGEGLLIVGESGCGKSSLLRALAGLWTCGSGRIVRPPPHEILFLPQRPYMILGTLRSQLLYPRPERPLSDAELLRLLERVNLAGLAERFGGLDAECDWEKVLSVGEQQRLAIARVLRLRPRYAILDEATSALDAANEAALYRQLAALGTTLISVAHRAGVLEYHRQVLELEGDGGWRLWAAHGYAFHH